MSSLFVTYTGRVFDPLSPDPAQIDILDIAHSLSNLCRFTGHCKEFYSVAQHSCLVYDNLSDRYKKWGLLHDASEAYLGDLARPTKRALGLGEAYREVEGEVMTVILEKYGLDWPMPRPVRTADNLLLRSEQESLMPGLHRLPGNRILAQKIQGWTPLRSEKEFLKRARALDIQGS